MVSSVGSPERSIRVIGYTVQYIRDAPPPPSPILTPPSVIEAAEARSSAAPLVSVSLCSSFEARWAAFIRFRDPVSGQEDAAFAVKWHERGCRRY